VLVPLGTVDLVDRAAAQGDDVKRVKAHARLGVGADRLLIAGAHVDQDRPDRRLLLRGEGIEECLQRRGVAARSGPHDRARRVVSDARQEAVIGAV
jgi:hypothetical protein